MVKLNFLIIALAALIPMLTGFIWYNEKIFGNAWKNASGLTDEKIKNANMPLIFGLSYLFSFLAAIAMAPVTIHQFHVFSMLLSEPGIMESGTETNNLFVSLMDKYGNNYRTFKHGAFHGVVISILLIVPVLATNALFERKGAKYILINSGYWILTLALMGGVVCAYN